MISQIYFALALTSFADVARDTIIDDLDRATTPTTMYLLLFQFVAIWLAVGITCVFVHKRGFSSIFGGLPNVAEQFGRVLAILIAVGIAVIILPPWGDDVGYVQARPVSQWLVMLPLSLLALLIQTGAEEVLFRGYLQQQLAARFRSPLIWMLIPSTLFALGHYAPGTGGDNALTIAIWAGVFGILTADITARAGTLGPAMAMHFINNLSAMLIVSFPDQMSGLSLYHTPFAMADADTVAQWLPVDFAFMLVMWLAARLAIRR